MPFSDFLDDFNQTLRDEFASSITFTPAGSPAVPQTLKGIIETGAVPEETDRGTYLIVTCVAADFDTAPVNGAQIQVDSDSYTIVDIDADQAGMFRMRLRRE